MEDFSFVMKIVGVVAGVIAAIVLAICISMQVDYKHQQAMADKGFCQVMVSGRTNPIWQRCECK